MDRNKKDENTPRIVFILSTRFASDQTTFSRTGTERHQAWQMFTALWRVYLWEQVLHKQSRFGIIQGVYPLVTTHLQVDSISRNWVCFIKSTRTLSLTRKMYLCPTESRRKFDRIKNITKSDTDPPTALYDLRTATRYTRISSEFRYKWLAHTEAEREIQIGEKDTGKFPIVS